MSIDEKKRPKVVRVTVVQETGPTILVQWDEDHPKRAYVPAEAVMRDNKCTEKALEAGIAYGIPWSEAKLRVDVPPDKLEAELRKRAIWNPEDLSSRPNSLLRAVEACTGIMSALVLVAKKYTEV